MSQFTFDEFMGMEIEDATSSRMIPVPEGEYSNVPIKDVIGTEGEKDGKPWLRVEVHFDLSGVPEVVETTAREEPRTKYTIFLDLNEDGTPDMRSGKNIKLGRVREAAGQNNPGERWTPTMLIGATVGLIRVAHRQGNDGEMYDQVVSIS